MTYKPDTTLYTIEYTTYDGTCSRDVYGDMATLLDEIISIILFYESVTIAVYNQDQGNQYLPNHLINSLIGRRLDAMRTNANKLENFINS